MPKKKIFIYIYIIRMQDDFTSLHTFVMVQDQLVIQEGGTENVSQHFMFSRLSKHVIMES